MAKRAVLELGSSTNFVYSLGILLCRILSYDKIFPATAGRIDVWIIKIS